MYHFFCIDSHGYVLKIMLFKSFRYSIDIRPPSSFKSVRQTGILFVKRFLNALIQNQLKSYNLVHNERLVPQTAARSKVEQVKT